MSQFLLWWCVVGKGGQEQQGIMPGSNCHTHAFEHKWYPKFEDFISPSRVALDSQ
jgi:hypothetical protein